MGTFAQIGLYSVIVLVAVTAAAAAFVLLGIWLSDASEPQSEDAPHA